MFELRFCFLVGWLGFFVGLVLVWFLQNTILECWNNNSVKLTVIIAYSLKLNLQTSYNGR